MQTRKRTQTQTQSRSMGGDRLDRRNPVDAAEIAEYLASIYREEGPRPSRGQRPCGSCGEPVLWLKHARTGRPAPIESRTDAERGNILVDLDAGTYAIIPAGPEREQHRGWLHLNHFVTCPQAKTWRKAGSR